MKNPTVVAIALMSVLLSAGEVLLLDAFGGAGWWSSATFVAHLIFMIVMGRWRKVDLFRLVIAWVLLVAASGIAIVIAERDLPWVWMLAIAALTSGLRLVALAQAGLWGGCGNSTQRSS